MGQLNIKYSYPANEDFDFETCLERLNLDNELMEDVYSGNGFIISEPKSLKKDLKAEDGIFSPRFGPGIGDLNAFMDRYRCKCGFLKGKINAGLDIVCPNCHTPVKYVGDSYSTFGWIPLKEYHIIHPNLYKSLEFFFGQTDSKDKNQDKYKKSKLYNMINYSIKFDQDGHEIPPENYPADQPYYGIGMIDFYEKFDDIMQYYLNKYPKKKEYYDDIMANRDKVFIQSIPVFTTHLRPTDVKDDSMYYEPINGMYNMMNILAHKINKNNTRMARKKKPKNQLLFDLQMKYMELYTEIEAILSGKKGKLRGLIGGRVTFSSRSVIAQDPDLRIDQITLPYTTLVITQQQKIINILHRAYNMSIQEAYYIWERAKYKKDNRVYDIIMSLIHANPEGMPVLINRNPTISYGSILCMYCVGITDTLTMGIPLQVLKSLAADFDKLYVSIYQEWCVDIPFNCWDELKLSSLYGVERQKQSREMVYGEIKANIYLLVLSTGIMFNQQLSFICCFYLIIGGDIYVSRYY